MNETTTRSESGHRGPSDATRGALRPEEDEGALVAAATRGEVAAFEMLYRKYVNRSYGICLKMTGNTHTAEELTQDAFLRAWRKLDSFRGDSAFGTWMHRLTVNVVLTHLRKQGRLDKNEVLVDILPEGNSPPEGSRAAPRMDIDAAVAKLPAGARTVFVLHDVEGYKHEEIGAMAGIAVGTSKAQLHRARALLREMLRP